MEVEDSDCDRAIMVSDRSSSHASINDPLWNVENNQSESLSFSLPLESNKPQPEPLVEHFLADPSFERSIASSSAHTSADPPSEQCIAPFSAHLSTDILSEQSNASSSLHASADPPSEQPIASPSSVNMDECSDPNLVTVRPMPKQFPIELCSFKINAKELLRSGVLTESGKREIVSELLHVMKKFQRYEYAIKLTFLQYLLCGLTAM